MPKSKQKKYLKASKAKELNDIQFGKKLAKMLKNEEDLYLEEIPAKGLGVKSCKDIKKGKIVCNWEGELVTYQKAYGRDYKDQQRYGWTTKLEIPNSRLPKWAQALAEKSGGSGWAIDGARLRNKTNGRLLLKRQRDTKDINSMEEKFLRKIMYINHDKIPNIEQKIFVKPSNSAKGLEIIVCMIATRDINSQEELLYDYCDFRPAHILEKLGQSYLKREE